MCWDIVRMIKSAKDKFWRFMRIDDLKVVHATALTFHQRMQYCSNLWRSYRKLRAIQNIWTILLNKTSTQENKTGKHLFLWAVGKSPNAEPISTDGHWWPPSQLLEVSMSEGSKGGSLPTPRWTGHRVWAGQVASDFWIPVLGTWKWCQMMSDVVRCQGLRMNESGFPVSFRRWICQNFQGYTMSIPRTCPATVGQRSWGTYGSCYERSWPVNTRYVKAKTLSTLQATWGRSIREPTFQIN